MTYVWFRCQETLKSCSDVNSCAPTGANLHQELPLPLAENSNFFRYVGGSSVRRHAGSDRVEAHCKTRLDRPARIGTYRYSIVVCGLKSV